MQYLDVLLRGADLDVADLGLVEGADGAHRAREVGDLGRQHAPRRRLQLPDVHRRCEPSGFRLVLSCLVWCCVVLSCVVLCCVVWCAVQTSSGSRQ
eukprot:1772846-Rhodomonas_salina.1